MGGGGGSGGFGVWLGVRGWMRFFGKIHKKKFWGRGGVDVNEENEVFVKIKKKIFFLGGGGRGIRGLVGGQRVDEMFWGKFTKKNRGGGAGGG